MEEFGPVKETVRVEIKEIKPPKPEDDKIDPQKMGMKICKVRNQRPVTNNFVFSPKILPHLREHIEEVRWNSCNKKITVILTETPTFSAYRWFSGINQRADKLKGNEAKVIDADVVYLSFLDKCNKEVARFKFHGIRLQDHECLLNNRDDISAQFGIDVPDDARFLAHAIELSYIKVEQIEIHGPKTVEEIAEEGIDDEWMTVEVEK